MSNNKKKVIPTNRQDTSQMDELKTEINNLPKDNPKACEGLIRELSKKISEVNNESVKERLHFDLKAVSCLGLNSELKKMVEDNGLNMEAIQLVLKYLTTKEQLGEYFFTHPNEDSESAGLDAVRRRLCPKLEVLGGLLAKGIDVTKPWVQKLVNAAPSLQTLSRISVAELKELCKGENQGEREVVTRLVKDAGSRSRQRAAAQDLQEFRGKEGGGKAIDHEKLKKAKALMKEAKKLATDQADEAKKAVNGKLAEITKTLQLPRDWNKDIGPEPGQLLQKLDGIIEKFKGVGEVGEPYQSEMEVVRKASGGRALCGIYYSEYVPPVTAEVPIIVMPDTLILSSPNNSQQVRYMQFSKSQAAADYVQSVKSSSSNIGVGIAGFYELAVGEFSGSKATRSDREKTTSEKMQTNSASVVQYIWIATKTFTIDQERLKLSASAIKMASTTVKDADTARLFMQRYGSHFPAGVHTLGGVLFRIVDAESESTKATTILAAKAANQLQGQISGGVLAGLGGIGVSISGEKNSSNGTVEGHDEKTDDVFYTFSSQAMGPATTNPATFNKMLANNSTWAIIDRGSPTAYIPIWEMIRDIDVVFEEAAKHLENTWRNDEEERMNESNNKPNIYLERAIIEAVIFAPLESAIHDRKPNGFHKA